MVVSRRVHQSIYLAATLWTLWTLDPAFEPFRLFLPKSFSGWCDPKKLEDREGIPDTFGLLFFGAVRGTLGWKQFER